MNTKIDSRNRERKAVFADTALQQAPPGAKSTWITVSEAATILHLSPRTVLYRAAAGKQNAKISEDPPFYQRWKTEFLHPSGSTAAESAIGISPHAPSLYTGLFTGSCDAKKRFRRYLAHAVYRFCQDHQGSFSYSEAIQAHR